MGKITIIEGWPIAAGASLRDVTVLLRVSSISKKTRDAQPIWSCHVLCPYMT